METTGAGASGSTIIDAPLTENTGLNNTGANGGGIDAALTFTGDLKLLNDSINANSAANGGGNTGFTAGTTQMGTVAHPLDPLLGSLQDNGGPLVGAPGGTFTLPTELLQSGSPALIQRLASARYTVGPLPPGVLGLTDVAMGQVTFSADAAGYGWFVDATPGQDEEFEGGEPGGELTALPGTAAAGHVDLLTAVLHEMGHLAGLPDADNASYPGNLMDALLDPGVRDIASLATVFPEGQ